jgi:hypothetical protein
VYQITTLSNNKIRKKTGFRRCTSMLCFISVITNGCIETMGTTGTTLSWFEEWFYFFERMYSRSTVWWSDFMDKYEKSGNQLRKIFNEKLMLLNNFRKKWPKFVSFDEDNSLRKRRWDQYYKGRRVIFWDNTNIDLVKCSNPEA